MKKILVIIPCLVFGISMVYGQNQMVTGSVTDAATGEPLPGVNIILQGTTTGTSTNIEGNYNLTLPSLDGTLVFSFIGFQTQEVPINGRTVIDIALETQALAGEELLVVGYGTQRREAVSGSVSSITGADLSEQPSIQTSAALMGLVPGVQVEQTSGQPGENTGTIRIRGIGTLGNSNPLVLIDGISGDIDDIASSDIENISILKDAAASAIYGSRGANGVILITTKRANFDQPFEVRYSGNVGVQMATDLPESVDGSTFMRMENQGHDNLGTQRVYSEEYIEQWETNHVSDPDNFPNTNWIDEVFTETALQQRHNLSVSGGSSNIIYRGSFQYDDEGAEIKNFNFKRFNFRLNTDINVNDRLSFKIDGNAIQSDQKEPSASLNLITRQMFRIDPVRIAKFSNGNFGPGRGSDSNPVAMVEAGGISSYKTNIYRGRFTGSYELLENLQFTLTYAPEVKSVWGKEMTKIWQSIDPETNEVLVSFPSTNNLEEFINRDIQHSGIFLTEYQQQIGDHNFNVLGGSEYIDFKANEFGAFRDNFPLQDFEQLNAGSAGNQQNYGTATMWRLLSFFGRVDYDFRAKYMFSSNFRYDGSSRFTEENRWGFFPSFSAAWRVSQERFLQQINFIDEFKIRGSWGVLGNQKIGNFPFAAVVNLGQDFIFGDNVAGGAAQTSLANPNISWEETTTTNIGLDLLLFDERFDIKFDLFNRITDEILLQLPMPLIVGMSPPFQNAGKVENSGWEIDAIFRKNIGSDLSFGVGFNLSNVKNEVVDLRGAGPFISGNTITREGDPINSIYGLRSDGLFQNQSEIDNHADQTGNIAPGDIKYMDLNGDGLINADDRDIIGDPFPSFNYGINLSINYKYLDIAAFFQGVGSRDVLLQGDAVWAFQNGGTIRPWQIESLWSPDNPDGTFPRLTPTTNHNNFQATDYWKYDASYLRLRNLQIGFNFPSSWTSSIGVNDFRAFFVGQNLFTLFDDLPPGIDPNVPNNTVGGFFPVNKLYSLGIDIAF